MVNGVVHIPLPGQESRATAGSAGDREGGAGRHHFIVGPENGLVEAAVHWVLDDASGPAVPVLFYGPSGTGKSHLARGLAAAWRAQFPRRSVVCSTAVDFARQFADAVDTQTVHDFRARYHQASLVVVEDLQFLAGKRAAQEELRLTLDALEDGQHQIILTTDRLPRQITGLSRGLQSRLVAGLTVGLAAPGREARLAILDHLASLGKIELSGRAAEILADGLRVTVPGLQGTVTRLAMSARLDGGPIDRTAAERFLAEHESTHEPALGRIASAVARHFSVKSSELRSPCRRRTLVTARGVAMYVARTVTKNSYEQIGRYFGGRDHSTVAHGCRKTGNLMKTDPAVRQAVTQLSEELQST